MEEQTLSRCIDTSENELLKEENVLIDWNGETDTQHAFLSKSDDQLKSAVCSICNMSLTDDQWLQASLPVRGGGLGIRLCYGWHLLPFWLPLRVHEDSRCQMVAVYRCSHESTDILSKTSPVT